MSKKILTGLDLNGPITIASLSGDAGQVLVSGGTGAVPYWSSVGTTTNSLTISSPLTGTSFNGSSAVTIGVNQSALSIGGHQITSNVVASTYGGTGVNNGGRRIFIQSGTPASPVAGDVWIWY